MTDAMSNLTDQDAAVTFVKAQLAQCLRVVVDKRGWDVNKAAGLLMVRPDRLRATLAGRWHFRGVETTLGDLVRWLDALGVDVQATFRERRV